MYQQLYIFKLWFLTTVKLTGVNSRFDLSKIWSHWLFRHLPAPALTARPEISVGKNDIDDRKRNIRICVSSRFLQ